MRRDLVRLSEDVHALSYRLHPSVLDDLGLVDALRAECDRVARHGDLQVEVDAGDVPDTVPGEASLCLFRVAQEALSNAMRHGRASAVTVLLSPRDAGLQLAVSDNGSGFDPGALARAGEPGPGQHALSACACCAANSTSKARRGAAPRWWHGCRHEPPGSPKGFRSTQRGDPMSTARPPEGARTAALSAKVHAMNLREAPPSAASSGRGRRRGAGASPRKSWRSPWPGGRRPWRSARTSIPATRRWRRSPCSSPRFGRRAAR